MKSKDEWRDGMRARKRALTPDWITEHSQTAIDHLRTVEAVQRATRLACYCATPVEVQTRDFIGSCLADGKRVCVPRHLDDRNAYEWAWIRTDTIWREGPWQVSEPEQHAPAAAEEIELAIVPAVAVDHYGHRLGHGGAHFDRLLARLTSLRVALVFEFQVQEQIPTEKHDVPVHVIVTDTDVVSTKAGFNHG